MSFAIMEIMPKQTGPPQTIFGFLQSRAEASPGGDALLAPNRSALSYSQLLATVESVAAALGEIGVRRDDVVAVVVSDGPEMAVSFLGVASGAICAPLNPAYGVSEFEFYLEDLRPRAIVIERGLRTEAASAADRLQVPVLWMTPDREGSAGQFNLVHESGLEANDNEPPAPDDIALVLHTSGTTGRPKIVPLSHGNLCAAAHCMGETYQLTAEDRFLSVMPLFHIQGLTSLTAALAAGGAVITAPGFFQAAFFRWLKEFQPTWYTASPAAHQFILSEAPRHKAQIKNCSLRFIRSSAAPLPPAVMLQLESVFGAPVLEGYGMTETCLHAASNPLPPATRKPGAVGRPATAEIAIAGADGRFLDPGARGEIVFRGPSVITAYLNAPEANRRSFFGEWLRSGDEGFFDEDGYLHVTGRLKEMINRGGEKIAPREIDEILMQHPNVAQAVTFAVPDARYGEEIGVAAVLEKEASLTEQEVRDFIGERLAHFKIPRHVVFVEQLPKGPTGKLIRIGLAERLGLGDETGLAAGDANVETVEREHVEPRTPTEMRLAAIWKKLLGVETVGVHDDFFALGGQSVLATSMFARIEAELDVRLPFSSLFGASTIAGLSKLIDGKNTAPSWAALVPLRAQGTKPPLFLIHASRGNVLFYRDLVEQLDPTQPVYGLQALGLNGETEPLGSIEEMAAQYIHEIRTVQPEGPYRLAGYCVGAYTAVEMARQLIAVGEQVGFLGVLNTDGAWRLSNGPLYGLRHHARELTSLDARDWVAYLSERIRYRTESVTDWMARLAARREPDCAKALPSWLRLPYVHAVTMAANQEYLPKPVCVPLTYFQGRSNRHRDPHRFWDTVAAGGMEIVEVPGYGIDILHPPQVSVLATELTSLLDRPAAQQRID